MSEYQYYEFLALDRPLTEAEQAEVRRLSTRARITATSFTNEYQWGDFRGSPDELMRDYYDPQVSVSATRDHVILDATSEDESGDWEEDLEGSLSAIVGVRSELAAGDLRPLYLAWLSGYGTWERDEDAFDDEDEDVVEPPVPAGLGSLTASQRALADFLRVDADLLAVDAETSPPLPEAKQDPRRMAAHIAGIPASEKDRLLGLVATGQAARARAELLRGFRDQPGDESSSRPRRTVAELLDTAWNHRQQRAQKAAAQRAGDGERT